jgi:hypothetical protein
MFEKKDRRRLMWSGVALVGAACLGHQAFAGNVVELRAKWSMQCYSAVVQPGQSMFVPGGQVLVDDITYAPSVNVGIGAGGSVFPSTALWPAYPLVPPPSYEQAAMPFVPPGLGYSIIFGLFGAFPNPGSAPVNFDTESWTSCIAGGANTVLQEKTLAGAAGVVVKTFDESTTVFHATMLARQTVFDTQNDGDRAIGFGLGISESLATISESRHFQTPVIIREGNVVSVVSNVLPGPSFAMNVYIKGRVIRDPTADAVLEVIPVITTP